MLFKGLLMKLVAETQLFHVIVIASDTNHDIETQKFAGFVPE